MSNSTTFLNNLLAAVSDITREYRVDKATVINALEEGFTRLSKQRFGQQHDIRTTIDPLTGRISIMRYRVVSENPIDDTEISVEEAQSLKEDAAEGDVIVEPLPMTEMTYARASLLKQILNNRIQEAEKEREYEDFKDRIGHIISGSVRHVHFNHILVDLGRAEGLLPKSEMIPRETYRPGDRIRCYVLNVKNDGPKCQIILSRAHPNFLVRLFQAEVPEISDGIVTIKAVARDPGGRAKVAVTSSVSSLDAVSSCVGVRGVRVQAITQELSGERIDVIPWSADLPAFIVHALVPATVLRIIEGDKERHFDVVVSEEQQRLAVGRRGQNIKLASALTRCTLRVMTEEQESEQRLSFVQKNAQILMDALMIDEIMAQALVLDGFIAPQDIAFAPWSDLLHIEGITEEAAQELHQRACDYLERRRLHVVELMQTRYKTHEDLAAFLVQHFQDVALKFAAMGLMTLQDFADLSLQEVNDILGVQAKQFNAVDVERSILEARLLIGRIQPSVLEEFDACHEHV